MQTDHSMPEAFASRRRAFLARNPAAAILCLAFASQVPAQHPWWATETVDAGSGPLSLCLDAGVPEIVYTSDVWQVTIALQAAPLTWPTQTVDETGYLLFPTDNYLRVHPVSADGSTVAAYYNDIDFDLTAAWRRNGTWTSEVIEYDIQPCDVGLCTTLSGWPAVAYVRLDVSGDDQLVYAAYDGTAWTIRCVVDVGTLMMPLDLILLPNGYPAIAYSKEYSGLFYAEYNGLTWNIEHVDELLAEEYSADAISLALLPDGEPAISYRARWNGSGPAIKYAWRYQKTWQLPMIVDYQCASESDTSLAIQGTQPVIAYDSGGTFSAVRVARFDGASWYVSEVPDSTLDLLNVDLRVRADKRLALAYGGLTPDIPLVRYAVQKSCPGDSDCDGDVDFFDIDYFLAALAGENPWVNAYRQRKDEDPPCPFLNNDVNGDGTIDFMDIDALQRRFGTICP